MARNISTYLLVGLLITVFSGMQTVVSGLVREPCNEDYCSCCIDSERTAHDGMHHGEDTTCCESSIDIAPCYLVELIDDKPSIPEIYFNPHGGIVSAPRAVFFDLETESHQRIRIPRRQPLPIPLYLKTSALLI